jgi:hypothetical protein
MKGIVRSVLSASAIAAVFLTCAGEAPAQSNQTIVLDCSINNTTDIVTLDLAAKTVYDEQRTPGADSWNSRGVITGVTDQEISWTITTVTPASGDTSRNYARANTNNLNRYTGILTWTNPDLSGTQTCRKREKQF